MKMTGRMVGLLLAALGLGLLLFVYFSTDATLHEVVDNVTEKARLDPSDPSFLSDDVEGAPETRWSFHLYDYSNVDAIFDLAELPRVTEVGPFVYRKYTHLFDTSTSGDRVSFNVRDEFRYDADAPGSLDPDTTNVTSVWRGYVDFRQRYMGLLYSSVGSVLEDILRGHFPGLVDPPSTNLAAAVLSKRFERLEAFLEDPSAFGSSITSKCSGATACRAAAIQEWADGSVLGADGPFKDVVGLDSFVSFARSSSTTFSTAVAEAVLFGAGNGLFDFTNGSYGAVAFVEAARESLATGAAIYGLTLSEAQELLDFVEQVMASQCSAASDFASCWAVMDGQWGSLSIVDSFKDAHVLPSADLRTYVEFASWASVIKGDTTVLSSTEAARVLRGPLGLLAVDTTGAIGTGVGAYDSAGQPVTQAILSILRDTTATTDRRAPLVQTLLAQWSLSEAKTELVLDYLVYLLGESTTRLNARMEPAFQEGGATEDYEPYFVSRPASRWMFNFLDPLLSMFGEQENSAWFVNHTAEVDAADPFAAVDQAGTKQHTLNTGASDVTKSHEYVQWQGMSILPPDRFWQSGALGVAGSTGRQFPPGKAHVTEFQARVGGSSKLHKWSADLLRKVNYLFDDTRSVHGTTALRFRQSDSTFAASSRFDQQVRGLANLTRPRDAPVFVSLPRFHLMDEETDEFLTALGVDASNDDDHNSFLYVERTSGTTLEMRERLQLNLLLQFPFLSEKLLLPVMWISRHYVVDEAVTASIEKDVDKLEARDTLWWLGVIIGGCMFVFAGGFVLLEYAEERRRAAEAAQTSKWARSEEFVVESDDEVEEDEHRKRATYDTTVPLGHDEVDDPENSVSFSHSGDDRSESAVEVELQPSQPQPPTPLHAFPPERAHRAHVESGDDLDSLTSGHSNDDSGLHDQSYSDDDSHNDDNDSARQNWHW